MKIAVFSDVHGNFHALEKVLGAIQKEGVDDIFCLGDLINGCAGGDAIIELLQKHQVQCVMGNHDHFLLAPQEHCFPEAVRDYAFRLYAWSMAHINEDTIAYLRQLPATRLLALEDGTRALLCHATPKSMWDLEPLRIGTNPAVLGDHYGAFEADLFFHGHDHQGTGVRRFRRQLLVNVSSLGTETDSKANYTIIESTAAQTRIQQLRVAYDWQAELQRMRERGVPAPPKPA